MSLYLVCLSDFFKMLLPADLQSEKEETAKLVSSKDLEIQGLRAEVESLKGEVSAAQGAQAWQETTSKCKSSSSNEIDRLANEKEALERSLADTEAKLKGQSHLYYVLCTKVCIHSAPITRVTSYKGQYSLE